MKCVKSLLKTLLFCFYETYCKKNKIQEQKEIEVMFCPINHLNPFYPVVYYRGCPSAGKGPNVNYLTKNLEENFDNSLLSQKSILFGKIT